MGFKLNYVKANGDISTYTPGFFVRRSNGEIWIVETKGREDKNDPKKVETSEAMVCGPFRKRLTHKLLIGSNRKRQRYQAECTRNRGFI